MFFNLVICFLLIVMHGANSDRVNETENNYCIDLKPQTSLDMEQLMGMWNGVEIIQHLNKEFRPEPERVCPVILISDTTREELLHQDPYGENTQHDWSFQNQHNLRRPYGIKRHYTRNLSLLWDEGSFTVEYRLRYDKSKPGLWISTGPTNDSYSADRKPTSFTGHVQVLKAVGTHLVLTFCHILPQNELSTVILARERRLNQLDIVSIHNLLGRRHLNLYHVQKVCRNNSISVTSSNLLSFVALLFVCLYHHRGRKVIF